MKYHLVNTELIETCYIAQASNPAWLTLHPNATVTGRHAHAYFVNSLKCLSLNGDLPKDQ